MYSVSRFVFLIVLFSSLASVLSAQETIFLDDGTEIRGELVGYDDESDHYLVQIGRFQKRIDGQRIQKIRGVETVSPPERTPVAPSPTSSSPSLSFDGLGGLLQNLQQSAGSDEGLTELMSLQAESGDGMFDPSSLSPEALQAARNLQNNPMMQQLMTRFRDPAYQRQLLDSLRALRSSTMGEGAERQGDDPQLKRLESLFKQLRNLDKKAK